MKNRIKHLLINGMKASEVAQIVGCSPGYVSQLVKDEDFVKEIEAGRIEAAGAEGGEETHISKRYQNMEHRILNAMEDALTGAELPQLTRALEVIAKVQDTKRVAKLPAIVAPGGNAGGNTAVVVNLMLPQHIMQPVAPTVQLNEKNEIIAIDNQSLAPMSASGVKNIFAQLAAAKNGIPNVPAIEDL